jgi:hypothetical protein
MQLSKRIGSDSAKTGRVPLTQEDLAFKADLTTTYLSQIEVEAQPFPRNALPALFALQVELADLVKGESRHASQ